MGRRGRARCPECVIREVTGRSSTLVVVEIELHVEGTIKELRAFVDALQAALGEDAEVRGWLGNAERDDETQIVTVTVDVIAAETQSGALDRVQPAVWLADPDARLVVGGTSTMQLIVPKPPEDRPPN